MFSIDVNHERKRRAYVRKVDLWYSSRDGRGCPNECMDRIAYLLVPVREIAKQS